MGCICDRGSSVRAVSHFGLQCCNLLEISSSIKSGSSIDAVVLYTFRALRNKSSSDVTCPSTQEGSGLFTSSSADFTILHEAMGAKQCQLETNSEHCPITTEQTAALYASAVVIWADLGTRRDTALPCCVARKSYAQQLSVHVS